MKRFYKKVDVTQDQDDAGFGIALDGRAVRTPAKQVLRIPNRALAEAVAAEWAAQGEDILPQSMPLTQLANTALDRLPKTRDAVLTEVRGYGDTDLLCYRATDPKELVVWQVRRWDPVLDWAERRLGHRPATTTDFAALQHPPVFHDAIRAAVEPLDDFRLAGLHLATGVTGSILLALALHEEEIDATAAFEAAMVDDIHQLERWGEVKEARERLDNVKFDLDAADRFLRLHGRH